MCTYPVVSFLQSFVNSFSKGLSKEYNSKGIDVQVGIHDIVICDVLCPREPVYTLNADGGWGGDTT